MLLMEDPPSCRTKKVAQTDNGIEKKTASVARARLLLGLQRLPALAQLVP